MPKISTKCHLIKFAWQFWKCLCNSAAHFHFITTNETKSMPFYREMPTHFAKLSCKVLLGKKVFYVPVQAFFRVLIYIYLDKMEYTVKFKKWKSNTHMIAQPCPQGLLSTRHAIQRNKDPGWSWWHPILPEGVWKKSPITCFHFHNALVLDLPCWSTLLYQETILKPKQVFCLENMYLEMDV